MARKDNPMANPSAEREAAWNNVIGIKAMAKKPHLNTGVILIAKHTTNNQNIRFPNLPKYINIKGDKLNIFPISILKAEAKYGSGE